MNKTISFLLLISIGALQLHMHLPIESKYVEQNSLSLIGTWHAKFDTTKMELKFNKDCTGSVQYSSSKKLYRFKYQFKSKSVIIFINKLGNEMHQFKLMGSQLQLLPYPMPKIPQESIELIDYVYFQKAGN